MSISNLRHVRAFLRSRLYRYPQSAERMLQSELYKSFWFYSVELLPGIVKQGVFPDSMPFPARMLLRNCDLAGADCLDIGSVEGLMPVLMCRQGARSVLATDYGFQQYTKLTAVKQYYDVNFRFQEIRLLYDLASKIRGGFDLIILSGVLYHVFSPMHVLAGVRPLLKKGGLLIVATNVVNQDGFHMEFNNKGRLQPGADTFWYPTIPLFDYLLRYFQLVPIDHLYVRYTPKDTVRFSSEHEAGYLAVVCRAVNDRGVASADPWMTQSMKDSWDYLDLCDQARIDAQPRSSIRYRAGEQRIDLRERVSQTAPLETPAHSHDTHLLKLEDQV